MKSLEQQIIQLFQNRIATDPSIVVPSGDDAAVIDLGNKQTVLSNDALVAGTHFLHDSPPDLIGHKLLAVSLSDLAAMGATPHSALLSLVLPQADLAWVDKFCDGFFACAAKYGVSLLGGNISRGPLSLHATVIGTLNEQQRPLLQSGAVAGDFIFVSGELGGAAYALQQMYNGDFGLQQDFWNVQPHIAVGQAMVEIAHSAIDISDGLHSDLQLLCDFGSLGAIINLEQLPIATALRSIPLHDAYSYALYGGEDYGLCFAVPPEHVQVVSNMEGMHCIGCFCADAGIVCVDAAGVQQEIPDLSWQHFA